MMCLLLLTGQIGPSDAATCRMDSFSFVFGIDTQTREVVKSGTVCPAHFNIRGGGINGLSIGQQAQHGTVGMAGQYQWAYRAAPGYVGRDVYTIRVSGEVMGRYTQRGVTTITVDVDVVP